ncbi:MAG: ComEC/Rec2 family competence protein [Clostridium butyricum]|nr:ComEC/Rec2 family competence protein [Clostridium butyricum]
MKKINQVNNPIIYLFLALGVSSISYGISSELRGLSILLTVLFLLWIFLLWGMNFTLILVIFFVVGLFINVSYYNIPDNVQGQVRIVKVSAYESIGSFHRKKLLIEDNEKIKLKLGEIYNVSGQIDKENQNKNKGIVGSMKITSVSKCNGDLITKLYEIKDNIYGKLKKNLGIRKAGLLSSIAFGYSDGLDNEDKSDMKKFGVIHSISVSGLHVAIVYGFFKIFLGNKLGLILCFIYVIFTGANYSSIRAFIMLGTVEGAEIVKRNNNSISSLCLSAMILTIYKPYSIFETSFHLSYLATLGIILVNKKVNNILYKFPEKLRECISVALSAQVFTVPYLLLIFNELSLNFIIGNLCLIPFVNILVILGNLLIVFYSFSGVFNFICYLILKSINLFDIVLNSIHNFSMPIIYGNEYLAMMYFAVMTSIYFIKKGFKKFVYMPAVVLILLVVKLYSPILSLKYYKEGAILVSYRGERVLISNKKQIDMERLAEISEASRTYRNINKINVCGKCRIRSYGKNYLLEFPDKKYLLKMSVGEKGTGDYDIINFKDGPFNKIFILNNDIIKTCS